MTTLKKQRDLNLQYIQCNLLEKASLIFLILVHGVHVTCINKLVSAIIYLLLTKPYMKWITDKYKFTKICKLLKSHSESQEKADVITILIYEMQFI
jgi:hypothetical protein